MALSATLEQAGFVANDLDTKATVELNPATLTIAAITLDLVAAPIQGLSAEQFQGYAKTAKENCPLSKALASVAITLNVKY
jgi:osmotically inducible protein OsmC